MLAFLLVMVASCFMLTPDTEEGSSFHLHWRKNQSWPQKKARGVFRLLLARTHKCHSWGHPPFRWYALPTICDGEVRVDGKLGRAFPESSPLPPLQAFQKMLKSVWVFFFTSEDCYHLNLFVYHLILALCFFCSGLPDFQVWCFFKKNVKNYFGGFGLFCWYVFVCFCFVLPLLFCICIVLFLCYPLWGLTLFGRRMQYKHY